MAKKQHRSEKYDFFKPKNLNTEKGPKRSKKEIIKLGFKWVKVAFFVFVAGMSLTGCIQSLVIKSSSTAGSGIEFYRDKNSVAPFVSTYQVKEEKIDGKTNQKLEFLPKDNFLLTNSKNDIEDIRKQWAKKGLESEYGKYDNFSSALRIIDKDGKSYFENSDLAVGNNKNNSNELMTINNFYIDKLNQAPTQFYDYKNEIKSIPLFLTKRPQDKPKENLAAYNIPSPAIGSSTFQAVQNVGTDAKPEWQVVKVVDGKYINNKNNKALDSTKEEDLKIIKKFKYVFQYEILNLDMLNAKDLYVSQAYARDYLQSLANVVIGFDQFSIFSNKNLNAVDTTKETNEQKITRLDNLSAYFNDANRSNLRFKKTTDQIKNPKLDPIKDKVLIENLISVEQKAAIEKYVTQITPLLATAKFNMKKMNFDGDNPDAWKNPYQIQFNSGINQESVLVNAAPVVQKPILSWSEAWSLGPFYGFVVYPISYLVNVLTHSIPNMDGWGSVLAIAIAVIIARLFTFLMTYKSAFAQSKQQMLSPKKAKIDAKYAAYKGNKQMEQRKRQEVAELYKKNNVNAITPLLSAIFSMPIFLAMWRVVQGNPTLKSTDWLGINFSSTSWQELFSGAWQYLPLMLVAVLIQAGAQLVPRLLSKKRMKERANLAEKEALKKSNRTQNIVMAVFIFMALIFEAGIQIYWIVGGIWMMAQAFFIHWLQSTRIFKEKLIKYV